MDEVAEAPTRYPGGWQPVRYEERCRRRRNLLADGLTDIVALCRSRCDIARLLVFGSYARDEVSPWSDLDLLVVVDGAVHAAVSAIYAHGALGEVIGVPAHNWRERLGRNPFGETILAEAREAYARSQS